MDKSLMRCFIKETMHLCKELELLTRQGREFHNVSLGKYRLHASYFYPKRLQHCTFSRCEARTSLVGHLVLYSTLMFVMIGDCFDIMH